MKSQAKIEKTAAHRFVYIYIDIERTRMVNEHLYTNHSIEKCIYKKKKMKMKQDKRKMQRKTLWNTVIYIYIYHLCIIYIYIYQRRIVVEDDCLRTPGISSIINKKIGIRAYTMTRDPPPGSPPSVEKLLIEYRRGPRKILASGFFWNLMRHWCAYIYDRLWIKEFPIFLSQKPFNRYSNVTWYCIVFARNRYG